MSAYVAAKHAVVGLSESLCLELRLKGVQVGMMTICPGIINTQITKARASVAASVGDAQYQRLTAYYAKQGAKPDVVAGARARRAPRTGARTGRSICDFSLLPAPLLTKTRAIPDIAGCTTCRLHLIPEPHTGSVRKQPQSSRDPYRSPAAYPESPSLVVCGVPRPVLHSRGAGCGDRHGQSRYRGALGQYPPLQPRNQHEDQDGAI